MTTSGETESKTVMRLVPVITSEGKRVGEVPLTRALFVDRAAEYGMAFAEDLETMLLNCSDGVILVLHLMSTTGQPSSLLLGGGNTVQPAGTDLLCDVFRSFERGRQSMSELRGKLRKGHNLPDA